MQNSLFGYYTPNGFSGTSHVVSCMAWDPVPNGNLQYVPMDSFLAKHEAAADIRADDSLSCQTRFKCLTHVVVRTIVPASLDDTSASSRQSRLQPVKPVSLPISGLKYVSRPDLLVVQFYTCSPDVFKRISPTSNLKNILVQFNISGYDHNCPSPEPEVVVSGENLYLPTIAMLMLEETPLGFVLVHTNNAAEPALQPNSLSERLASDPNFNALSSAATKVLVRANSCTLSNAFFRDYVRVCSIN